MIKYAVERHMPYVVSVCVENGGCGVLHRHLKNAGHGVEHHLPYAACMKNGGCGV